LVTNWSPGAFAPVLSSASTQCLSRAAASVRTLECRSRLRMPELCGHVGDGRTLSEQLGRERVEVVGSSPQPRAQISRRRGREVGWCVADPRVSASRSGSVVDGPTARRR
jgi:hypothetical protein